MLLLALLAFRVPARAEPPLTELLSGELAPRRLEGHLQRFVDRLHLKAFRHLGDERDFDHGHILFDAATGRPFAILYHTQELAADEPAGSDYGFVDADARNWIQRLDRDQIENASAYLRETYPAGADWNWFKTERLPALARYRTIVDRMLDPGKLGAATGRSLQWVFTRRDCAAPRPEASAISIRLPDGERVCLEVSAS